MAPPQAAARGGLHRRDGSAALALITAPLARGDGYRLGLLGDTGTGKTWAAAQLVALPGQLALIHDDSKHMPEYPAVKYFTGVAELLEQPADEARELPAVGFRGDAYRQLRCEVEEVAALALRFARNHVPVRLVVDELNRAVTTGGRQLASPALLEAITAGRTMGLSVVWGTQTPQRVPGLVFDQSSAVAIFRLGPRALGYLDDSLMLDREMLEVVPTLAEGDFVLHRPACPWDRTVYRF